MAAEFRQIEAPVAPRRASPVPVKVLTQPEPNRTMTRLQATVPPGAPPNALLRVRLPDGTEVKVRVPEGLSAGDEFQFQVNSLGEIKTVKSAAIANSGSGKKKNPKKKRHAQDHHAVKNTQQNNRTPLFISVCLDIYQKLYETFTSENEDDAPAVRRGSQRNASQSAAAITANETKRDLENYFCFLDRDIINGRDICTALAVGMFIGLSTVLGFLAGVLWVTPVNNLTG